jgi:hypothetical protein
MAVKMVIDTANLLFRVAAVNRGSNFGTPEEQAGLALHMAFQSVYKYYKKFKPDQIAFSFEGMSNWRKKYTASSACISGNQYKANRVKDASMEPYFALMDSFREVMTIHSSAIILRNNQCEGDDMIAGYVQLNASEFDTVIIISGDRDFVQLLKLPNVRLINPDTGKDRNLPGDKEYYEDIDYFLFKKCVRGDKGDYVFSAYPNVRETRIKKAYEDEKERAAFMRETWSDKDDQGNILKTYVVGDLFEENKRLMDLSMQPDDVKQDMFDSIIHATENIGTYSNFHFLRFLGKHRLDNISQHIDQYTDLLCANSRYKKRLEQGLGTADVPVKIEAEVVAAPIKKKMPLLEF